MATTRRLSALGRDTTTIPQLTLIASAVFGGRRNKSFHIPQADHWRWIPAHCLRRSVVLDNWRKERRSELAICSWPLALVEAYVTAGSGAMLQ